MSQDDQIRSAELIHNKLFNKPHLNFLDNLEEKLPKSNFLFDPMFTSEPVLNAIPGTDCPTNKILEVDALVDNLAIDTILDTGASSNYISAGLIHDKLNRYRKRMRAYSAEATVANQSTIKVVGLITLPIQLGEGITNTTFMVVEALAYDMILGMQYMTENKVVIDFDRHVIKVNGSILRVRTSDCIFSCLEDVHIPAYSETVLTVHASRKLSDDVFVQSSTALQERMGIFVGHGVLTPQENDKYKILVCNLTPKHAFLPSNTILAQGSSDSFASQIEVPDSPDLVDQINVDRTQFTEGELETIDSLLSEYRDLLAVNPSAPGTTHWVTHSINTGNSRPINQAPHRTSAKEKLYVEEKVGEMKDDGIIRLSKSPWSAPVILVKKKDGSIRFCIDYRKLNEVTERDVYPLPRIDDCLSMLQGNVYFSSLDLSAYYWQIPMEEADKPKTAFITPGGLYEFNVMPFGLTNAPATSQRLMDAVFAGLKWRNLLVYLDDIIIFSRSFEAHVADLREAFGRLRSANLKLKATKCFLFKKEINYLGHLVTREGVKPDPAKARALKTMRIPTNKSELRSFLGLAGYYRKFVYNFATVAYPLYNLTREQVKFVWQEEQQNAFDKIVLALTSTPLLIHPDFSKPFIVQTDACDNGIGAVLTQVLDGQERVVMYISRTLQPAEQKWCVREKEALAIIFACESFRPYLIGTKFTIQTDHQSLQWLMKAQAPARLVRWALKLIDFDFVIQYRKGASNSNADCLSRLVGTTDQIMLISSTLLGRDEWVREQRNDPALQQVLADIERGQANSFELVDHILYRSEGGVQLLVVPSNMVAKILRSYHDDNAHASRDRLRDLLRARFFWVGMMRDAGRWVNACLKCRRFKPDQPHRHGMLQPIEVMCPFEMVGVDIVGPLHITRDRAKYILVCTDYFTNWIEAAPLKTITANEVAQAFFNLIIARHGCPKKVLSDQGTQFTSAIFKNLCSRFNMEHVTTTAYHQQCNGKTERFIRFLTKSLSTIINESQTNWDAMINDCLFMYRVTICRVLDDSPFYMLYGRDPVLPQDLSVPVRSVQLEGYGDYKRERLQRLRVAYDRLRERRIDYQQDYKAAYDKSQRPTEFGIGSQVMIFFPAQKVGLTYKFLAKWDGPYEVVAKLTDLNYRVEHLRSKRILVVHVQRMLHYKPYINS